MHNNDFASYRRWKVWNHDNFYALPDEDRHYFTKELECCGIDTSKGISVFEIGFGNANFAKYCHEHGFVYAGSELDPELVGRALSLNIEAYNSSQGMSKIAGERLFDLVVAFDVFEHIEMHDLIDLLKDAREILSEGGRIIARFPSGDSPFSAPIFNGDMTHRTLIGIGKLDQVCKSSSLRIVRVHAQSITVLGLGFGNAIKKVLTLAGRRLISAILAKLYFGNQSLVFDPNMIAVLEAEPIPPASVRDPLHTRTSDYLGSGRRSRRTRRREPSDHEQAAVMPRIDVVIPCYNAGRYLSQCVRSVLSQGVDSLRLVIIDNASTDGSAEVARRLAADDGRIEVVCHARNLGPHASFNEGVDLARGEYFMILCADDLLTEGSLRRASKALESNPDAVFALGADLKMFEGKEFAEPCQADGWRVTEGTRFIEDCCRHSGFSLALGAVLIRTVAQKKAGHHRACLAHANDLEMALRLARLGSVVEFKGALGIRREHPAQLSVVSFSSIQTQIMERMAVFDSFFGREGRDVAQAARLYQIARRRIAEVAIRFAARRLLEGDPGSAAAMLAYGIRLSPAAMLLAPLGREFRKKIPSTMA